EKALGELICAAFVSDVETILFPRAVKERDHPVAEKIEEFPIGRVLFALALDDRLRVRLRQNTERAGQPHKRDGQLGRTSKVARIGSIQLVQLARRKGQRGARAEPNHFASRITILAPDGKPVAVNSLEQSHRLKEIEAVRFIEQLLAQRRICSPILGGHRLTIPSRCLVLTTS